ncbi:MAG: Holliday junction branch migration protein RuvA [Candidatus Kapabacteria bacterium]|nr:Holliday junction branch migration protein RuvA [Candidatus Kapabacteria bacterium]MDW7996372.1 Holliday junction branch migration protein RuvA [Bacteroidota bacterium]MDW8225655.1 Holliday junction branch migration protein RuvA [Bacteroidota bacterium]
MVAFVEGELIQRSGAQVVLQCAGVGVRLTVPLSTLQRLPELGQRVRLWTVMEFYQEPSGYGEYRLYGFFTEAESHVFELLRRVSGIGTKTALTVLSAFSVTELRECVLRGDVAALQRLPGVGRKTAERLILELRERIVSIEPGGAPGVASTVRQEALLALMALGYKRGEADRALQEALRQVEAERNLTAEELVKAALRALRE